MSRSAPVAGDRDVIVVGTGPAGCAEAGCSLIGGAAASLAPSLSRGVLHALISGIMDRHLMAGRSRAWIDEAWVIDA